jgi:hypothetical protein
LSVIIFCICNSCAALNNFMSIDLGPVFLS